MEIRRSGNFGIIDTGTDKGLISFSIGGRGKGWEPSSIQLNRRGAKYFLFAEDQRKRYLYRSHG